MAQSMSHKVLVCVAIGCYLLLAVLAFVPGPRLFIRNDFRYLNGSWYREPSQVAGVPDRFASGALNPDNWTSSTDSSRLAQALERNHRFLTFGESEQPAMASLERYCDSHPSDAEGWAHLARLATQSCQPRSDPAQIDLRDWARW